MHLLCSLQTIRFACESNALCVRGNHDDAALAAYYDWREASGRDDSTTTPVEPDSKYAYVAQFTSEDVRFLEQLPFTLSLPSQNAIVVHAGLVPSVPLSAQRPIDMYKMRFLLQRPAQEDNHASPSSSSSPSRWTALESKKGLELAGSESVHPWVAQWDGPAHVYFGHDAIPGLQVSECT